MKNVPRGTITDISQVGSEPMLLRKYIYEFYKGNNALFGRKIGCSGAHIGKCVNEGAVIIDGTIYTPYKNSAFNTFCAIDGKVYRRAKSSPVSK